MSKQLSWKNLEIIPIKRTGKWITGIIVQESEGKRRLKLFKGVIKESGQIEVMYKGEKLKISLVQRFNIPNRKYWFKLNQEIIKLINFYLSTEGQKALSEFKK
ncbi:MAG: hypothetical protein OH319_04780 [Candidatus Parvarchaeota archaeon]|nr:hypothetical protein [Candidatus Jingweiarchaeum tengchongense]MCW1298628.1 hypothetical protein [Candidatus Jingweiarchaeum tengchongense]MCW1304715.1 hypothetical protein [Candidatus Jingweiarchaeum tengchongense]MCW1306220.1 hypothetical protein [Candidatus Jingweiarchaeum tengchongense]MCW1311113.1 hypothetical protein [Candidatus Jingweiarchaeum tengchongense]